MAVISPHKSPKFSKQNEIFKISLNLEVIIKKIQCFKMKKKMYTKLIN